MKKSLLITLLLFTAAHLFAARQQTVEGRVADSEGKGIAYATVVLLLDNEQTAGTTTDDFGHFALVAPDGHYTLTIQHLSFEPYSKQVEITGGSSLGTIVLTASKNEIEEVVVKGELVRREADRFVVDVAASPTSAGKDGVELLERAPGVWINDDKISINGRSGSKVYVNDIELTMSNEQLITYIRTLRAEEIQKIEVIPTSGADYDADSASGIIKITLKRRRENGLQGSVQMQSRLSDLGSIYNPSANIAIHSGRVDLNGAAWYTHEEDTAYASEQTLYRQSNNRLNSTSEMDDHGQDWGGRLDAVIELSKNHTLGFGGRYTYAESNSLNLSQSQMHGAGSVEEIASRYDNNEEDRNAKATFNYIWKIDTLGSTLKLLGSYQDRSNNSRNLNESRLAAGDSLYNDRTDSKYRIGSINAALEKHLSKRVVLQAGGKYTYYRMQSAADYTYLKEGQWITNERESFAIDYNEQIAALYGIVRANFDRWGVTIGLRGEYTYTESEGSKLGKDYFSLFPNANISYKLDKAGKHMLIAQYARKISRPSFWQLNPQRQQISDYSYQTGNPDLDPSYTHDVGLTLVLWHKYTLSAGLNLQTDEIQQAFVTDPEDPDIIFIDFVNYKDSKQYYVNLNAPMQLTKWWEATANLTYVAWEQRVGIDSPATTSHFVQSYASSTFSLPKKFYIDLSWSYHNRIHFGNAAIASQHQVNTTLKKRFGDRFTATCSVNNLFNTRPSITAANEAFERNYAIRQFWSDRQVRIALTWNFKSGKAFRERKLEQADDSSRL